MSNNFLLDIFTKWRNPLMRQARRFLSSEQDAEDVLQDVFLKLWTKQQSIASEKEAKAIASVAVRNKAIDKYRESQKMTTKEIDDEADDITDSDDVDGDREAVVRSIMDRTLNETQRKIVQMREYDGLGYDQIAKSMGMSQEAVRMQLSRARKAICNEYRKFNHSL